MSLTVKKLYEMKLEFTQIFNKNALILNGLGIFE